MSDQQPPFDDEERELAQLYGKLPRATPSPALDEAVLRQAREAVPAIDAPASRPRGRPRHGLRWAGAFAVAASLVLAANLAWQQRQLPVPQARPESAKDKAEAAPAASAMENATASRVVGEPQPPPAMAVEGEVAARKAAKGRNASTALRAVKTPPPPLEADQASPELARVAPAQQLSQSQAAPATTADAMEKVAPPAPVVAAAPAPPPAEIVSPPPSPAAAPPELAESAPASTDQRPALEAISVVMGSPSDAEPRRRVAAIRQMLRDGHEVSARKAYADLRRDFPGFVVPRDLAPLAK